MKSISNNDLSFEFVARKVGVREHRIPFLKKFYESHCDGLVELRDAAIVNGFSGEELHAIFIYVGQAIYLKIRGCK